jgi:hypothetical protein
MLKLLLLCHHSTAGPVRGVVFEMFFVLNRLGFVRVDRGVRTFRKANAAPPPFSAMKSTPASSKLCFISCRIRSDGESVPASKSAIVSLTIFEAEDKSS